MTAPIDNDIPQGHPQVGLIREREGGIADPVQVRQCVLETGDVVHETSRESGLEVAIAQQV
jgi:hypothetical protein